jgi:hypothetical protein
MAGGEVALEDLLQAMATSGWLPETEVPSILADHQAAQLAGTDTCDQAAAEMSITRLHEILKTASLADLQRAVAAVYLTRVFQTLVLLIGMARVGGMDQTQIPAWPQIAPDTLRGLQDDPMWWAWGRHMGLSLNQARLPMVLVVNGLWLLMEPGMLAAVEGYRDRLGRLGHAVDPTATRRPAEPEPWPQSTGPQQWEVPMGHHRRRLALEAGTRSSGCVTAPVSPPGSPLSQADKVWPRTHQPSEQGSTGPAPATG